MPTFDVFVIRHEAHRVRFQVRAEDREDAIKFAEEQYESGESGTTVTVVDGHIDWSTADVRAPWTPPAELPDEHVAIEIISEPDGSSSRWVLNNDDPRLAQIEALLGMPDTQKA